MKWILTASLLATAAIWNIAQAQTYEQDFQARKLVLIDQIANANFPTVNRPDPEKHNWPRVLARLERYGIRDTTANRFISQFSNNSPFHFTLVGMARIMGQYPQADTLIKYRTQYLTNVFARQDSYNAWTGEGTENHTNMNRTSGYLYAQYALGNSAFPQSASRLGQMKQWIKSYSRQIYATGVGEWNSSTYEAYNLVGWLNLFDLAQDTAVRACARAVIDYYALELALHYSQGATGGAEMRGVSLTSLVGSADYVSWLWFGDASKTERATGFFSGNEYSQAIHPALSRYRPDPLIVAIARKQVSAPVYYTGRKGDYLLNRPGYTTQHFLASPGFTLGSAQLQYGGFTNADFQIGQWKLVGRVAPGPGKSAEVITGNGRFYDQYQGRWRNPFDQIVQHENTIIQISHVPVDTGSILSQIRPLISQWQTRWQQDFLLRFPPPNNLKADGNPVRASAVITANNPNAVYLSFPNTVTRLRRQGVHFLELEGCFVAVRTLAKDSTTAEANEGNSSTRKQIQDQAVLGQYCGLITEVAEKQGRTLTQFATAYLSATQINNQNLNAGTLGKVVYTNMSGEQVEVQYNISGSFSEPIFDWGFGVTTQQNLIHEAAWQEPMWPSGPGFGRVATYRVNGAVIDAPNDIYGGPGLSFNNRILIVGTGQPVYVVDYTDSLPRFGNQVQALAKSKPARRLTIYPNPGKGHFNITLPPGAEPISSLLCYDPAGSLVRRKVISFTDKTAQLNLQGMAHGTYQIIVVAGKESFTERVVLQ